MVTREEAENTLKESYKLEFAQDVFKKDFIKMAEDFWYIQPYFYDKHKLWWLWNFKTASWDIVDDVELLNMIRPNIPARSGQDILQLGRTILSAMQMIGRERIPEELPKTWVQLKNKIVDIKTGEIMEASAKYLNVNPIPWDIGNTYETPIIDKIFGEWVEKKYIKTLYEIIAYCTLPSMPMHRIFCFTGSGTNGKSSYLNFIRKFIGGKNCSSTELDLLISNRFETAALYKRSVAIMGETNFNLLKNTSMLKRISGGDLIRYEFKGKDTFSDYSYAKPIIATNSLPMSLDNTDGFHRRWIIIDFPNKFNEKKDILEDIPEQEYKNLAKKITIILKELLEKREFTNEGSIEEKRQRYDDRSNPLQKFLKENTHENGDGYIFRFQLNDRFESWTKERGYRSWTDKDISDAMRTRYDEGKREANSWRAWLGLSWNSDRKPEEINIKETQALRTGDSTRVEDSFFGVGNGVRPACEPSLPVENDQNVSLETYNSLQNLVNIVILKYINEEIMTPAGDFVNPKEGDMLNLPLNIALKLIKVGQAHPHMWKVSVLDAVEVVRHSGGEMDIELFLNSVGWEEEDLKREFNAGTLFECRPGIIRVNR